ncbi:transmembrane protein 39A-like isoform X1 [Ptychodera flava]|uniref:transmembrane protein 39A-like isoform X1 n=1 Tax=Ptychodera flava TaxID=63121 RepID=UPI003969E57E
MPGGRRGPGRPQISRTVPPPVQTVGGPQSAQLRQRNGPNMVLGSAPVTTTLITITPIKHQEIPDLPTDHNLFFELIMFFYLVMALLLQYINIYRTVWWLPHSPANAALNFYLIDVHLVIFIIVVLTRRLVWKMVTEFYSSLEVKAVLFWIAQIFKCVVIMLLLGTLIWTLVNMFFNNSVLNLLFLAYPLVSYFLLYGSTLEPNKSTNPPQNADSKQTKDESRPTKPVPQPKENGTSVLPYHKCTLSPDSIRDEADYLRCDFNARIKQVLFNSMVCAYYVGFVPVCFVQNSLYFDVWWSCQHIGFVWLNSFVMFSAHFMPSKYCDVLHRCALHLGKWQKIDHGYSNTPQHVWSDMTVWPQGVLVRYNKGLYKAMGPQNVAYPADSSHARFYFMFHKPLRLLNWLIILQLILIFYQLYLLLRSTFWNHIITLSLMLFSNYYIIFKLLRDRFVLAKVYSSKD